MTATDQALANASQKRMLNALFLSGCRAAKVTPGVIRADGTRNIGGLDLNMQGQAGTALLCSEGNILYAIDLNGKNARQAGWHMAATARLVSALRTLETDMVVGDRPNPPDLFDLGIFLTHHKSESESTQHACALLVKPGQRVKLYSHGQDLSPLAGVPGRPGACPDLPEIRLALTIVAMAKQDRPWRPGIPRLLADLTGLDAKQSEKVRCLATHVDGIMGLHVMFAAINGWGGRIKVSTDLDPPHAMAAEITLPGTDPTEWRLSDLASWHGLQGRLKWLQRQDDDGGGLFE